MVPLPLPAKVTVPAIVSSKPLPSRVVYLQKKAAKLSNMITKETGFEEMRILDTKLAEIQAEISEIVRNPLEYELCVEQPWAMECRLYD